MGQRLWDTGQSPIQFQSVSSALFQEKAHVCVITSKKKDFFGLFAVQYIQVVYFFYI